MMCILEVSALQDTTNANAPLDYLDGDEISSVQYDVPFVSKLMHF